MLCVEIRLKNAKRLKIRLKNEAPMLEAKTYSQTDIFSEVRLQRSKHSSTGIVSTPEAVVHGDRKSRLKIHRKTTHNFFAVSSKKEKLQQLPNLAIAM